MTSELKIKTYSIPQTEYEAGDYAICSECGAMLRHVVELNGTPYGRKCAASVLGWNTKSPNKIAAKLERVTILREGLQILIARQVEATGSDDWLDWNDRAYPAMAQGEHIALELIEFLNLDDPYNRAAGPDYCADWKYIAAAAQMVKTSRPW